MAASSSLAFTYDDMARREVEARIGVVHPTASDGLRGDLRARLRAATDVMKLMIATTAVREAADELGLATFRDLEANLDAVLARANLVAGFDAKTVLERATPPDDVRVVDPTGPLSPLALLISLARSVASGWPIDAIEEAARDSDNADLGHDIRQAHNWICAFVRRHSAGDNRGLRAVARAYVEGRLSIEEVADVLGAGATQSDALAWLDEHGFRRDLDGLSMTDEQRAAALARLRADRERRGGKPVLTRELVVRDVLATQRIEDVDARPWIRRESR